MFGLGIGEIVIIFAVFVVIFFGGKKITGLGKAMGRFTGEFKKGKMEIENEIKELKETGKDDKTTENSDKVKQDKSN